MRCPYCDSGRFASNGTDIARRGTVQRFRCKDCGKCWRDSYASDDIELIKENVRLSKQRQRFMDSNRIERKSFREFARIENAVEDYSKALVELFERKSLSAYTVEWGGPEEACGVIQISDTHFNELVDLVVNKYDFSIASKRLKRFVDMAMKYFSVHEIKSVLIAITGDLLNSDRRLDELLQNSVNRARATFLAVDLLQQVILQLNQKYNVSIACVTGNESRVKDEPGWVDSVATENYDFTIFNILRHLFKGASGIHFVEGDATELVVGVSGVNVLLMHGYGSQINLEKSITQIIGRYAAHDIPIHYVLLGHKHSARISDTFARSSSLTGPNDYSEKALNLTSRASQNCFIFYRSGNIDGIKIDLQVAEGEGYGIDESLASYNPKSASKVRPVHVIHKIVV